MAFWEAVDTRSRWKMQKFLAEHFRYDTMSGWNCSTSYACNMKIYNLDVPAEVKDKLYEMLDCQEVYDRIQELIDDFNVEHDFRWQAAFNGRSGGYLVLYQGGSKPSEHKSFCRFCGQRNFTSVKETGNVCGRCRQPGRIDYAKPPLQVFTHPGKSTDMDEDFEGWSMDDLRARVKLVQEFDALADNIVLEVRSIAESCSVREEVYYKPKTRKVLAGDAV